MSDDDVLEAIEYSVPAWDCPVCGNVHLETGQDSVAGEETRCDACGVQVAVVS